jgi:hypothetical protein
MRGLDVDKLKGCLELELEEEIVVVNYGDSLGFLSDLFELEFGIYRDNFVIKNINVEHRDNGYGRRIVSCICDYLGDRGYCLELEGIREDAKGFWNRVLEEDGC